MAAVNLSSATSDKNKKTHADIRKIGAHPDHWYPLARSRDLKPGKVIGRQFAGQCIALVRPVGGPVFALEDRCAHRQVPLSVGQVCGKHVQCGYHGWTFDDAGNCTNVPYVGKTERIARGVRSFPCREAYGLIFVFPGNAECVPGATFPNAPASVDPAYKTRYLDRQVGCHYSFLHENLMDMNHQFLHRGIMSSIHTGFLDLREGENWVEVDYTFSRTGKQPVGEQFILGKRSAPTAERPRDLMTVRTEYPHQTLTFWTAGSSEAALELWITYVPVDARQRINHTFGLMSIRKPGIPGLIHLLWPFICWFTEGIFREDRWIVELEQSAFDRQGEDQNQEIFPVILSLRQLLISKGLPIEAYRAGSD